MSKLAYLFLMHLFGVNPLTYEIWHEGSSNISVSYGATVQNKFRLS